MSTLRIFNHYVRVPFLVLGLIEIIGIFSSVVLGSYLLVRYHFSEEGYYLELSLKAGIMTLVMLLSMIAAGLYQARLREGTLGFILRLTTSYLLGILGLSLIFYIFPDLLLGRGIMAISLASSFAFILVIRWFLFLTDPNLFKKRILVLGAGKRASVITELRRKSDQFGFTILGFVHLRGETDVVEKEKILNLNMPLIDYVDRNDVDEIVMAIEDRRKGIPMRELLDCKMHGVDIIDVLTFFERETGKIRLDQLQPSWLLFSQGFNQGGMRDFSKRAFDIVISAGLLLLTWPFMLLAAIAIWLESGCKFDTPIFFKQVRVGLGGRPFQVLKFRSMVVNAEKSGKAQWATKNDSRVTRVGKLIRKIRVDELPQIFNVFRGDMSFVGPRPERPEFVVMLSEKIPYYAERHHVKPGITGWAQLLYPYGSSEKDAMEKLQYDLYYVKNHSIFLDFLIMLQTAEVVLFGRGAR
ncbi:MAG: TIGR03013 family PEP-CTERM/XrtA system glycosyltransferase [Gammaproteobacteria bacterium]|nr:TIGR03013 family PEP-CTERM/XrtA system glycosyltransferase [Gammaproteobacteria bacterium]